MTSQSPPSCWYAFAALICLAATFTIEFLASKDLYSVESSPDEYESDFEKYASWIIFGCAIVHVVVTFLTCTLGSRCDPCCQTCCGWFSILLIGVNVLSTIVFFFECMVKGGSDEWYTWVGLLAGVLSAFVSGLHSWKMSRVRKSYYKEDCECYC